MLHKKTYPLVLAMVLILFTQGRSATPDARDREVPWLGVVTLSEGGSLIARQEQSWSAVRGAGLRFNDRLITGQGATVSLTVYDGPSLTIAENSQVTIYQSNSGFGFAVAQGEVRVVHGGEQGLELKAPDFQIELGRSIVRFQRSGNVSFIRLEAGSARIGGAAKNATQLNVDQTYIVHQNRMKIANASPSWIINVSKVRLASAQQSSPKLELPSMSPIQGSTPNQKAQGYSIRYCDGLPVGPPSSTDSTGSNDLANQEANLTPQPQDQAPSTNLVQNQTRSSGDASSDTAKSITGPSFTGSSSLSLGSFSGSSSSFSSGGLFADAGQQTFEGQVTAGNSLYPQGSPFPGSIHLVTAERNYSLSNVQLNATEQQAIGSQAFYSVGVGTAPVGQVITDAFTGTNATPTTLNIQSFGAHIVRLDQYGVPDPATPANGGLNSNIGITGLVGATPTGPVVIGTAPLVDQRAQLNGTATFALGEFRVSTDGNGGISFAIRRSDQDRLIVKDANGNDANDLVTVNSDVRFEDIVDARFLPQSPTVKSPLNNGNAFDARGTTYTELNSLRKAAFTTIMADTLQGYSNRTGQTRFVVDGRIIDISGYRPSP